MQRIQQNDELFLKKDITQSIIGQFQVTLLEMGHLDFTQSQRNTSSQ